MKQVIIYSLKVWLTSAVVAPIIFMVVSTCVHHYHFTVSKEVKWYLTSASFYLILSIVPWAVTLLWFKLAIRLTTSISRTKLVAFVIVAFLVCAILLLSLGWQKIDFDAALLWVSTAVSIAFFIRFYKLGQKTTTLLNNEASTTI